jgi:hypothetical protein
VELGEGQEPSRAMQAFFCCHSRGTDALERTLPSSSKWFRCECVSPKACRCARGGSDANGHDQLTAVVTSHAAFGTVGDNVFDLVETPLVMVEQRRNSFARLLKWTLVSR